MFWISFLASARCLFFFTNSYPREAHKTSKQSRFDYFRCEKKMYYIIILLRSSLRNVVPADECVLFVKSLVCHAWIMRFSLTVWHHEYVLWIRIVPMWPQRNRSGCKHYGETSELLYGSNEWFKTVNVLNEIEKKNWLSVYRVENW